MQGRNGSRIRGLLSLLVLSSFAGCTTTTAEKATSTTPLRTVDGLERIETTAPGILDLRPDHGIGSYDGILIPDASLSYARRGTARLSDEAEKVFMGLLRQTLVDAVGAAAIPVETRPGECTMTVSLAVYDLVVDPREGAEQLSKMTLVMEFRDSASREPLLRYGVETRVESPTGDVTKDVQMRRGLTRIVADMDISRPLRGAGLAEDEIRPGCNGTLAARGRAAAERPR